MKAVNRMPILIVVAAALVAALSFGQQFPPPGQSPYPPQSQYPAGNPQGFPQQQYPPQGFPQQQGGPQNDNGDAPEHGVARISLINGNVSVAHGDQGEMSGASINAPLVTGDRILTGDGGRAEVQFDGANMIRLAPGSEVRMGDLQDRRFLVQIAQGMVTFRVFQPGAEVEISTPSVSVHPVREGVYRVMVRPDGTSEITVRQGEAEIASPTGSEPLHQGSTMMSRGPANDPEFRTVAAIPNDDWDRWNADRDRIFERAANENARYMSPDMYGTEEMAGAGHWVYDPQYGNVWVPYEDADWAPYRDGRWSYIDYYGWSWIGYEPWGWAPYHYGRWYRGSFGWAWWPGPAGPRYYWRPALVGFFGWGSPGFGVSFGFGFGNVGWVPLAPYEAFHPWYGRGFYGGRGVVINNTNIVNVYHNARFTNAVTSVRAGDFGRGSINSSNFVRANAGELGRAGSFSGGMPFAAPREARAFSSQSVSTRGMPNVSANTRFFSNSARGASQPAAQSGGWRRLDSSGAGSSFGSSSRGFNNAGSRGFNNGASGSTNPGSFNRGSQGSQAYRGGINNGQSFGSSTREAQPVRIAPPIVGNRNESNFSAPRGNGFDGFGGPRPNGGAQYSAPRPQSNGGGFGGGNRGPSGGGSRGASGGHSGGGGHGGHR